MVKGVLTRAQADLAGADGGWGNDLVRALGTPVLGRGCLVVANVGEEKKEDLSGVSCHDHPHDQTGPLPAYLWWLGPGWDAGREGWDGCPQ